MIWLQELRASHKKNYCRNTTPLMVSSHHWRNVWRNITPSPFPSTPPSRSPYISPHLTSFPQTLSYPPPRSLLDFFSSLYPSLYLPLPIYLPPLYPSSFHAYIISSLLLHPSYLSLSHCICPFTECLLWAHPVYSDLQLTQPVECYVSNLESRGKVA